MKRILSALLRQFVPFFLLFLGAYLLRPVPVLFSILIWTVLPLAAMVSAFRQVKRDVNPYAAWFLPPAGQLTACLIATAGYVPSPGHALVLIVACLTGAAAGDVYSRKYNRKKK